MPRFSFANVTRLLKKIKLNNNNHQQHQQYDEDDDALDDEDQNHYHEEEEVEEVEVEEELLLSASSSSSSSSSSLSWSYRRELLVFAATGIVTILLIVIFLYCYNYWRRRQRQRQQRQVIPPPPTSPPPILRKNEKKKKNKKLALLHDDEKIKDILLQVIEIRSTLLLLEEKDDDDNEHNSNNNVNDYNINDNKNIKLRQPVQNERHESSACYYSDSVVDSSKNNMIHQEPIKANAIIQIQRVVRGYVTFVQYEKTKQSICIIQSIYRRHYRYNRLKQQHRQQQAIIRIQSFWRMYVLYIQYKRIKNYTITIQCFVRFIIARSQASQQQKQRRLHLKTQEQEQRQVTSIIRIQSIWRMKQKYIRYKQLKSNVIIIQCYVRSLLSRLEYHQRQRQRQLHEDEKKKEKQQILLIKHQQQQEHEAQQRRRVVASSIRIQSIWRMNQKYLQYKRIKTKVSILQCFVRSFLSRLELQQRQRQLHEEKKEKETRLQQQQQQQEEEEAIIRIQSFSRMNQECIQYKRIKTNIIIIQCFVRSLLARLELQQRKRQRRRLHDEEEREKEESRRRRRQQQQQQQQQQQYEVAIIRIQSFWRMDQQYLQYKRLKTNMIIIQCFVRSFLSRLELQQRKRQRRRAIHEEREKEESQRKQQKQYEEEAIICIQSFWRMNQAYLQYKRLKVNMIIMQCFVRSFLSRFEIQRKRRQRRIDEEREKETRWQQQHEAIIRIQSFWRMDQNYSQYKRQKKSVIILQCFVRSLLARLKLQQRRRAILHIQSLWRMDQHHLQYKRQKTSVITIQCFVRSLLARLQLHQRQRAILRIQSFRRMTQMYLKYKHRKASVVILQCFVRSLLARIQLNQRLGAIICIQSFWRMTEMYLKYKNRKAKILLLQCFVRSLLARVQLRQKRQQRRQMQEEEEKEKQQLQQRQKEIEVEAKAIIRIQSALRMYHVKSVLIYQKKKDSDELVAAAASSAVGAAVVPPPPSSSSSIASPTTTSPPRSSRFCISPEEQRKRRQSNIMLMREKARTSFVQGNLREAVLKLTIALKICRNGSISNNNNENTTNIDNNDYQDVTILSNRAAALLLLGANDAAASDCQTALERIPQQLHRDDGGGGGDEKNNTQKQTQKGDPYLRSKLLTQLGWCYIRIGKLEEAKETFDLSMKTAQIELEEQCHINVDNNEGQQYLESLSNNIIIVKDKIRQCKEALESINQYEQQEQHHLGESSPGNGRKNKNKNNNNNKSTTKQKEDVLQQIDLVLNTSTGNMKLHEKKINVLASMKQWRRVAYHCEYLALQFVGQVGCFTEDLTCFDPYVNNTLFDTSFRSCTLPKYIKSTYFSNIRELNTNPNTTPCEVQEMLKLIPEAVGEAVLLLLPTKTKELIPFYLKSLRLEGRFLELQAGIDSLKNEAYSYHYRHHATKDNADSDVSSFSPPLWLSSEEDRLNRIVCFNQKGDECFYSGNYEEANDQYAECLKIDFTNNDSQEQEKQTGSINALHRQLHLDHEGGRFNAILHCSRASCLMSLDRYLEASIECTAAIRIHPYFMKAILLKSRCYAKLQRYNDSIVTYKRWLEIVNSASTGNIDIESIDCIFDGPWKVSREEVESTKTELKETIELKEKVCGPKPPSPAKKLHSSSPQKQNVNWFGSNSKTSGNSFSDNNNEDPYGFGATAKGRRSKWASERENDYQKARRSHNVSFDKMNAEESPAQNPNDSGTGEVPPSPRWKPDAGKPKSQRRSQQQYGEGSTTINNDNDMRENHYTVLDVPLNATTAEIKKAYRTKALDYHPDKNKSPGAADKFRSIQLAYEILTDEKARRKYNREIW